MGKLKFKGLFTKEEKMILKATFREQRPMSLKEIAEKANDISWVTARKYVKRLVKRKWLIPKKVGKRRRFEFNYDKLDFAF